MKDKKGLIQKVVASMLIFVMFMAQTAIVGITAVTLAIDMIATNSNNVEFMAYFEENTEKITEIEKNIDEAAKLNLYVTVKNEGYLSNAQISLEDAGFRIKDNSIKQNEYIEKIENNIIYLKQINADEYAQIELEIEMLKDAQINVNSLNKNSQIKLTGTYYNSKRNIQIEGLGNVRVKWNLPEDTKAELAGKLLTNYIYTKGEERKRVIQVLIASKIENDRYPIKNTQIEVEIPEGVQKVEAHKRTTHATNGNKSFNENNYIIHENRLIINVDNNEINGKIDWTKNLKDIYVVTFELPEETEVKNKEIKINSKITTYNENQSILHGQEQKVAITEEKEGIVTVDQKEEIQEMYKGKIYSGEDKEYITYTRTYIDYSDAIDGLLLEEKETVFERTKTDSTGLETKDELPGNIQYKEIKFNKSNIESILGQKWEISIIDQNQIKVTITDETEANQNGIITATLEDGAKELKIETSKVQNNGFIEIQNIKTIRKTEYTRDEIKDFTGINNKVQIQYMRNSENVHTEINTRDILLKETETKAELKVEQSTITTKGEQELHITTVLLTDNESKDLYKNPELKIKLPEQVQSLDARCKLLYGNGLEIESATKSEEDGQKLINVKLKGEQEKYQGEAIDGAKLLINAKVKLNSEANNSTEKIVLNYTNENAIKYANNAEENVDISIMAIESMNLGDSAQVNEQIDLDFSAKVGKDELRNDDIIRSGEIIHYFVKLTNTSTETIENISFVANIPNDGKLVELNPLYNTEAPSDVIQQPYYNEKTEREFKKETISIEAGKTLEYEYLVKMNTNLDETKDEISQVSVKYNEQEIKTATLRNKLANSKLEISMIPLNNLTVYESGHSYAYSVLLYNPTEQEQTDIKININKNDFVNISSITYSIEGQLITIDPASNFTIPSIPSKETANISIFIKISQNIDNLEIAKISVTAEDLSENIYRSNEYSTKVSQVLVKATLGMTKLTENNNEYLHQNDQLKYTINLQNIGEVDANTLSIIDRYSNYVLIKKVTLNGIECEYTVQDITGEKYNELTITTQLNAHTNAKVEIIVEINPEIDSDKLLKIVNKALIYNNNKLLTETEELDNYAEIINSDLDQPQDDEQEEDNEEETANGNNDQENNDQNNQNENQEENSSNNESDSENDSENNNSESENSTDNKKYSISGQVWIDTNKNGVREITENNQEGIKVYAINVSNNTIATDTDGKKITAITNDKGYYVLDGLSEGSYIVVFEYNTQKYIATEYQVEGVSLEKNSDAVTVNKIINGKEVKVAATDEINLNENILNIDLGLMEINKFDLDIEKVITKIVVTNKEGTKTFDFDDENLAKAEINSKYLSGSNVIIEYKIKVINNGDVPGYAKKIVDYMPSSLSFNSSLNNQWYKEGKNLYNTSLSNTEIKPGEEKEIKLVLNKVMTKSNTGLVNNKVEIDTYANSYGIQDIDIAEEKTKDIGSADVLINPSTGATMSYILLSFTIIFVIFGGTYLINSKIYTTKK